MQFKTLSLGLSVAIASSVALAAQSTIKLTQPYSHRV